MTEQQKTQTIRLRTEGYGYSRIAAMLGVSDNTIKSFCRRQGLTGKAVINPEESEDSHACRYCGLPVKQTRGRKEKHFCSDRCRMAWWNTHKDAVDHRAIYNFVCRNCHKSFTAYGNARRKYCSHECYIKDRFGGRTDD